VRLLGSFLTPSEHRDHYLASFGVRLRILIFSLCLCAFGCGGVKTQCQMDPTVARPIKHIDFVADNGLERFGELSEFTDAAERELARLGLSGSACAGTAENAPCIAASTDASDPNACYLHLSLTITTKEETKYVVGAAESVRRKEGGVLNATLVRNSDVREVWRCKLVTEKRSAKNVVKACFKRLEKDGLLAGE